jgi:hypothetical protein
MRRKGWIPTAICAGFQFRFLKLWRSMLRWVDVEHSPHDRSGEHLPKRLRRFEAVAGRHRHPPGRDLDRVEFVQVMAAEGSHGAREQEAQLLERHRRDLVLGEVLVDELGEGGPSSHPTLPPELLQRSLECRSRVGLDSEAAALHAPRVASSSSEPVGPEAIPIGTPGRKLEDLALLQHRAHSFRLRERVSSPRPTEFRTERTPSYSRQRINER